MGINSLQHSSRVSMDYRMPVLSSSLWCTCHMSAVLSTSTVAVVTSTKLAFLQLRPHHTKMDPRHPLGSQSSLSQQVEGGLGSLILMTSGARGVILSQRVNYKQSTNPAYQLTFTKLTSTNNSCYNRLTLCGRIAQLVIRLSQSHYTLTPSIPILSMTTQPIIQSKSPL